MSCGNGGEPVPGELDQFVRFCERHLRLEGSFQADRHAEVREREHGPNPHREEYEEARAIYLDLDARLQASKRENVRDRIEDVPVDHAVETIRNGFRLLAQGCEAYDDAVSAVRDIALDTPGLNGQSYGHDPRPAEWLRLAVGTLDGELAKPRLTPQAEAKLDG
jgi:hypothetical protein